MKARPAFSVQRAVDNVGSIARRFPSNFRLQMNSWRRIRIL